MPGKWGGMFQSRSRCTHLLVLRTTPACRVVKGHACILAQLGGGQLGAVRLGRVMNMLKLWAAPSLDGASLT